MKNCAGAFEKIKLNLNYKGMRLRDIDFYWLHFSGVPFLMFASLDLL